MFFIEYDEKRAKEQERQEERIDVATRMIKKGNMAASFIAEMCSLSEDTVRNLAKSLNIAIQ